ncbi:MAG TPA: FAD-binding protein, partial [Chloroflexota bacterium]|nr:FAD-binding protein [Chloroflexota bacterium]
ARAVLIATGGGATMYKIAAPSLEKSGDGVAMAWRAGARLMDLEMMQFHPTGLLAGRSRLTGSVLEEGLRGAGGHLKNGRGERYMGRYDADRLERSTRDVVSRSSFMEIAAGRGSPNDGVYIDVSHLGAREVERMFPGMVERCRSVGFDLANEPVEVSPTAHFHMGGITIDTECRSNLAGLYAAGEDASGVHGANRLGGNGVAESIVFGARAGDVIARDLQDRGLPNGDADLVRQIETDTLTLLGRERGEDAYTLRQRLGELTWTNVGLVRSGDGLAAARTELDELYDRSLAIAVNATRPFNMEWTAALDVRNLIEVARLICRAALARTESRGSHYRSDFPTKNDATWLKNIYLTRTPDGTFTEEAQEVALTRLKPGEMPAELRAPTAAAAAR